MTEISTLSKVNLFTYNFNTWLIVMFCLSEFVNVLNERHQDKFLCTFKCHW